MDNTLKNIYCIIPAFNEGAHIAEVVKDAKLYVDRVIVVDDGSSDNTFEAAESAGAIVLRHLTNRGQGAALETGDLFALSAGAYALVHFDADGQFLATEINDMIEPISNGQADVVIGSRFLGKRSEIPRFKRYVIFPIAKIVNRILFGIRLTDPQNGFRALSRQAAEKIRITNDGGAHCTEIIASALSFGFRIKEVPVSVIYNDFGQGFLAGKGRGVGGFRIFKDLLFSKIIK